MARAHAVSDGFEITALQRLGKPGDAGHFGDHVPRPPKQPVPEFVAGLVHLVEGYVAQGGCVEMRRRGFAICAPNSVFGLFLNASIPVLPNSQRRLPICIRLMTRNARRSRPTGER